MNKFTSIASKVEVARLIIALIEPPPYWQKLAGVKKEFAIYDNGRIVGAAAAHHRGGASVGGDEPWPKFHHGIAKRARLGTIGGAGFGSSVRPGRAAVGPRRHPRHCDRVQ
jgi:hypothetical protein